MQLVWPDMHTVSSADILQLKKAPGEGLCAQGRGAATTSRLHPKEKINYFNITQYHCYQ
jgi:hypothetical protein